MADLASLENEVVNAENEYSTFQSQRKNPIDLLNEAGATLGLPEVRTRVSSLRKSVLDTENLLNSVEGSVKGRTSGSLVTEAQRQRLTNMEREPIYNEYKGLAGNLDNESANLSDLTSQATTLTELGMKGQDQQGESYQTKITSKKDALTRAKAEEADRIAREQADRDYQIKLREQAESEANSATSRSTASTKKSEADIVSEATSDIQAGLSQWVSLNKPSWWTEETLIPRIQQVYPELSLEKIKDIVYTQRRSKQYGGE